MDTRVAPGIARLDVVSTESAPRVTPPGGVPFKDMVSRGASALLQGAQAAITSLPGAPIVAAAIRPGGGTSSAPIGSLAPSGITGGIVGQPTAGVPGTAENPLGGGTTTSGPGAESASVENTLAQSQEQNLYYLQLQEQLAAENRTYSAMSNVLKTRHDTVKNAIGNIR
jgi:hypothetical protein